jgi:hypothetical protein
MRLGVTALPLQSAQLPIPLLKKKLKGAFQSEEFAPAHSLLRHRSYLQNPAAAQSPLFTVWLPRTGSLGRSPELLHKIWAAR